MPTKHRQHKPKSWRTPARVTVLGFAIAGLIGTILLSLPMASATGEPTPVLDAGFTSISALCVTGLIVVDTATHWSIFGQVVIIALIQIGGLGVMTLGSILATLLLRKMGVRQKINVAAMTRASGYGGLRQLLFGIAKTTIIIEGAAALILTIRFLTLYQMPFHRASWQGIFHSISSFNNAGFGLHSTNLEVYNQDPWILLPICLNIILGGLGFPVILELSRNFRFTKRFSVNTRMVLFGTAVLLVVGTVLLAAAEWHNPQTLGPLDVGNKILNAFSQSVFARTAGFNSVSISEMHDFSWFVLNILMFIGAGPAGTAGGVKITTVFVLLLVTASEITGQATVNCFGRSLPRTVQREASAVLVSSLAAVLVSIGIMLAFSPFSLGQITLEVVSAFGTVGLSTGITSSLNSICKLALMMMMFLGRLGPVTLANSLAHKTPSKRFELPEERPIIG